MSDHERPDADPVELLAGLNPVPDDSELAATADHPSAAGLLARLLADTEVPAQERVRRARRRRRRIVTVTVLGVTAVSGVAAAVVLTGRPADDPLVVSCYAEPVLSSREVTLTAPEEGQSRR